jgi:outer membrane receptor protein involved in Fe transport
MKSVFRYVLASAIVAAVAVPASAAQATQQQPPAQPPATTQPPQKPKDPPKPDPTQPPNYEELVVVSGSRTEQKVVNAPATMSVITAAQIENVPTQNFAELLRSIPGINITQVSARDINLTSRGATGTLATGQLALLDGRSIYQDFFGFVMWDFLPVNLNEIKQIEVIRGPASAVWGANALNGVVNVITKSPREMQGTSAVLGFGTFERANDEDSASLWYVSGTHAQAINDRWAYKLSAGGYSQDPFSRPTGQIPCTFSNVCGPTRQNYPGYANSGTTQPKFDGRVDYDFVDGKKLSFSGGFGGTDGIMHSGIGPFDIDSGSTMGYGKAEFRNKGLRAAFFTNILDGDAVNLLTKTPQNQTINFAFKTKTIDFEVSNVQTIAQRHVINYGGNLRFNTFDLELAKDADDRTEFGIYGQDEIFLSNHFRLTLGARVDRFDYLDDFVFSPRVALLIKPQEDHTFRLSFNRAYRSPSVVNNFLDVTIAEPLNLTPFSFLNPALAGQVYNIPIRSVGNEVGGTDLQEQSVDAFEIGYTGVIRNRTVVSAVFFVNKTENDINFDEVEEARWTPSNPPPQWPLPPAVIGLVPGGSFPALFTYKNLGKTTQKGLELGIDSAINQHVNVYANYSWQGEPDPEGFDLSEMNIPAENRFNTGVGFNYSRFLGNLSVSFSDDAFWQDVLDARYAGTTEAYTLVNAGFGVKWAGDKLTTSVKAVNLLNDEIQQHVFGDVMKRQFVFELRVNFPR